jgi:hypothetical protein
MHMVTYAPGEQRRASRYSVAVLSRPNKEAIIKRLRGGRIPTVDDNEREGIVSRDDIF